MGFEFGFEDMEGFYVSGSWWRRVSELLKVLLPMVLRRAESTVRWMEEEDLNKQAGEASRGEWTDMEGCCLTGSQWRMGVM